MQLIDGFASELSLEILSTTAYILDANPNFSFEKVLNAIGEWSIRKRKLFKEEYVRTAYEHLMRYREFGVNLQ